MSSHTGDRAMALALALVSLGLVAAVYAVWTQQGRISDNQTLLKQQQTALTEMVAENAQARQEQEQLRSLVLRLQQQVRDLGGTPAELPLSSGTQPAPGVTAPGAPSPRATPSVRKSLMPTSPSPRPSPSQHPPSGSPSPSPLVPCLPIVCRRSNGARP